MDDHGQVYEKNGVSGGLPLLLIWGKRGWGIILVNHFEPRFLPTSWLSNDVLLLILNYII